MQKDTKMALVGGYMDIISDKSGSDKLCGATQKL